jgi:hypothetical protein
MLAFISRDVWSQTFEDEVVKSFTADVLSQYNTTRENVQSIKLAEIYSAINILNKRIGEIAGTDWAKIIEGNTMAYYDKMRKLSEVADDRRVLNICEIGFNSGYSALNFLVSNPKARFISFDIFLNGYVPAAVRSLQEMYPDREITVVAGSSSKSVLNLKRLIQSAGAWCQLIFIDGSHLADDLRTDIRNMRALADPSFNRVIIDDIHFPHLSEVWNETLADANLGFKPLEVVDSDSHGCISWESSIEDGTSSSYRYIFNLQNVDECKTMYERNGWKYDFRRGSLGVGYFEYV